MKPRSIKSFQDPRGWTRRREREKTRVALSSSKWRTAGSSKQGSGQVEQRDLTDKSSDKWSRRSKIEG